MRMAALALLLLASAWTAPASASSARAIVVLDDAVAPLPGVDVLHRYSSFPGALVAGPPSALARLAAAPGVRAVHPDEPLERHLDLAVPVLGAGEPHVPRGAGATIALVDAGIDASHPGLSGRVELYSVTASGVARAQTTQDATGHGTHVAGVLVGNGAESPQSRYRGVAPEARLIALDLGAAFTVDGALRAFDWLAANAAGKGIRVVTNSWGRAGDVDGRFDPDAPLVRASDALVDRGLVVVFSAGNRGAASSISPEALNPRVLTVGATDAGGRLASFSSAGPGLDASGAALPWVKPDLVAVGENVVTARSLVAIQPLAAGDRSLAPAYYATASGTSLAAPQVAAAAALVLAEAPHLSPSDVASLLRRSARDLGPAGADDATGAGLLDLDVALLLARGEEPERRERAVAVSFAADVVSAGGIVTALPGLGGAPPSSALGAREVRGYLPVLPGAGNLRAEVAWTSRVPSEFTARLVAPDGRDGPTLAAAGAGRLAADVAHPAPGVWQVRATPGTGLQDAALVVGGTSDAGRLLALVDPLGLAAAEEDGGEAFPFALGAVVLVVAAAVTAIMLRAKFA